MRALCCAATRSALSSSPSTKTPTIRRLGTLALHEQRRRERPASRRRSRAARPRRTRPARGTSRHASQAAAIDQVLDEPLAAARRASPMPRNRRIRAFAPTIVPSARTTIAATTLLASRMREVEVGGRPLAASLRLVGCGINLFPATRWAFAQGEVYRKANYWPTPALLTGVTLCRRAAPFATRVTAAQARRNSHAGADRRGYSTRHA